VTDNAASTVEMTAERRAWRPQTFGMRRLRDIDDPLIEPAWDGIRVLVHLDGDALTVVDEDGQELEIPPNLAVAIADSARASELVADGYLSAQPGRSSEGLVVGRVEPPTAGQVMRQLFIGTRRSDRASVPRAIDIRPGDRLVFVAVDLLSIDGQPLLDVPLLERKRLLESAMADGELVRRGLYVRPPVERWLMSWRAMGFGYVAYKGSNGRYTPGRSNDTWTIWKIPPR
jgi:ATP-dependent DNA ligase